MIDISASVETGSYLPRIAEYACALSHRTGDIVTFLSNGHRFVAYPDSTPEHLMEEYQQAGRDKYEAYLKSPKGQRDQQERALQQRKDQDTIDLLVQQLPQIADNEVQLIRWLVDFFKVHEEEVSFNKEVVLTALYQAGYGRRETEFDSNLVVINSTAYAKWIIANCIDMLENTGAMHQLALYHAEEYLQRWG